jgi:hypothetical protein
MTLPVAGLRRVSLKLRGCFGSPFFQRLPAQPLNKGVHHHENRIHRERCRRALLPIARARRSTCATTSRAASSSRASRARSSTTAPSSPSPRRRSMRPAAHRPPCPSRARAARVRYSVNVKSAPPAEPVTRAEAKLHLKVDATADDALIDGLIVAAREWTENYCRRSWVQRTLELRLDCFPARSGCRAARCPDQLHHLARAGRQHADARLERLPGRLLRHAGAHPAAVRQHLSDREARHAQRGGRRVHRRLLAELG